MHFRTELCNLISDVLDETPNISVITQIEALSWVNVNKNKEQVLNNFIQDSNIIFLTPEIVSECIQIKRNKKIKTPDAIIAATAIVNNLILLTSDKDFKKIDNLNVMNPFDI